MGRHRAYLAASALGAANTAYAYRPPTLSKGATVWSWAVSMPTAELPLQYLTGQAAMTAVALARGAGRTRGGRTGLALSALSAAGLLGLHRSATRAGDVLEAALVDGLGPDYRSQIARPRLPGPDAALAERPGVHRMLRIHSSYAKDTDLPYGPAGKENLLDVWRRPDLPDDAGAPVLLQVPGGAWVSGNKQGQAYPLMSHLAEHGWVCVSMSYRLSPRATWPDHVVDVKRAIAWVKANIDRYGGDPRFVAITGGSAGGHLAALAALTPGEPAFQPGFPDADTTVQAAVPYYGVYDLTDEHRAGDTLVHWQRKVLKRPITSAREVYERASPLSWVRPDAPPLFLLHGTKDVLVHVDQARRMAERLRRTSTAPVVYAELPGATHAFDIFGAPRATAAAEAVERFLGVALGRWRRQQETRPGQPPS